MGAWDAPEFEATLGAVGSGTPVGAKAPEAPEDFLPLLEVRRLREDLVRFPKCFLLVVFPVVDFPAFGDPIFGFFTTILCLDFPLEFFFGPIICAFIPYSFCNKNKRKLEFGSQTTLWGIIT